MPTATVKLWGTVVGYVSMEPQELYARFEYDPDFVRMGIEVAPLQMPAVAGRVYVFSELQRRAFHGLPGLLADSLPDKYGNSLINVWLARTGRKAEQFNAVDRLCYAGTRGMGALEFEPQTVNEASADKQLEVAELVELASLAFANKESLEARFANEGKENDSKDGQAMLDILSIGTSAGGARAKAVIAFNPKTREVRSGQMDLPPGFEHWLIKFDGVEFNGDWGVADPAGYGLLEYSYYLMAIECGINMEECRRFEEGGRTHFMTRRFDRGENGEKYFVQSLGAIAHYDYWESGYHSYEQVLMTMRELGMGLDMIEEMVRRIIFNIVGCNQDDHVKNISFMMDREGQWRLSPAYDLCHAQGSDFTRHHQLSLNGKTNSFDEQDVKHLGSYAGLPRGREKLILEKTVKAFSGWQQMANTLGVPESLREHVRSTIRLNW
ncbi:MAG: type II toxin-antitoxin system HipA family toxin [Halioglobus sp.]